MLFREVFSIYLENHTKHAHTGWAKCNLLTLNVAVYTVTIVLIICLTFTLTVEMLERAGFAVVGSKADHCVGGGLYCVAVFNFIAYLAACNKLKESINISLPPAHICNRRPIILLLNVN